MIEVGYAYATYSTSVVDVVVAIGNAKQHAEIGMK